MTVPVIIIFGAAVLKGGLPSRQLRDRTQAAFDFGGTSACYMPTGAIGRHSPSEADVMAEMLMGWGVPPANIRREQTARNTRGSAHACARLLRDWPGEPAGTQKVMFVSSRFHMLRCGIVLRLAGVAAAGCPPPQPYANDWYWRIRECVALPNDLIIMLVHRRMTAL